VEGTPGRPGASALARSSSDARAGRHGTAAWAGRVRREEIPSPTRRRDRAGSAMRPQALERRRASRDGRPPNPRSTPSARRRRRRQDPRGPARAGPRAGDPSARHERASRTGDATVFRGRPPCAADPDATSTRQPGSRAGRPRRCRVSPPADDRDLARDRGSGSCGSPPLPGMRAADASGRTRQRRQCRRPARQAATSVIRTRCARPSRRGGAPRRSRSPARGQAAQCRRRSRRRPQVGRRHVGSHEDDLGRRSPAADRIVAASRAASGNARARGVPGTRLSPTASTPARRPQGAG
jgi:hypothetical protein